MIRIASLILAGIPLLGVLWIVVYGSPTTVDGLFMILILLAMSGILGTTALFEIYKKMKGETPKVSFVARPVTGPAGSMVQGGTVQSVFFYEAEVGHPNKSLVTLSHGSTASQLLVFEGDVRNALPVGQKVEITFRKASGYNVLGTVHYA